MKLMGLAVIAVTILVPSLSHAQLRDGTIPYSLKLSATNDPETNPTIKYLSNKSHRPEIQNAVNFAVFRFMLMVCPPVETKKGAVESLSKSITEWENGKSKEQIADLNNEVRLMFPSYFSVTHAVEICAGAQYLFGKNGVLMRNFVIKNGDWRKNIRTIANIEGYIYLPEWKR